MDRIGYSFRQFALFGSLAALVLGVVAYFRGAQGSLIGQVRYARGTNNLRDTGKQARHVVGGLMERLGRQMGYASGRMEQMGQSTKNTGVMGPVRSAIDRTRGAVGFGSPTPVVIGRRPGGSFFDAVGDFFATTFGAIGSLPGTIVGAIGAVLLAIASAFMFLVVTALTLSLVGAFILFVFAPEPRQRQELWDRTVAQYHQLQAINNRLQMRLRSRLSYMRPPVVRHHPEERRAA